MKVVGLFPGYGSQFVGMAKELYDAHRIVQEYFEEASSCLNEDFVRLCFASSEVELSRMEVAYPASFLVSSAIAALLEQEGVKWDAVAGYNQGEYTALSVLGGLSFPDGLYLLNKYSSFYRNFLENERIRMVWVDGIGYGELEGLCSQVSNDRERVYVSIYYSDTSYYVGGHTPAVEKLCAELEKRSKVKAVEAAVEIGLHSPLMKGIWAEFAPYLEKVDCRKLRAPLLDGISIDGVSSCQDVKYMLLNHIKEAVDWGRVVEQLGGYDLLVGIGLGTQLTDDLHLIYPDKKIISVNTQADIDMVKQALQLDNKGKND